MWGTHGSLHCSQLIDSRAASFPVFLPPCRQRIAPPCLPGEGGIDQVFERDSGHEMVECPCVRGVGDDEDSVAIPMRSKVVQQVARLSDDRLTTRPDGIIIATPREVSWTRSCSTCRRPP